MEIIIKRSQIEGNVIVPPSKSDAQRALIAALLSHGKSTIHNLGNSADVLNVLRLAKKMGAIVISENPLEIYGMQELQFSGKFNIGESGLALRVLTTAFALNAAQVSISGRGTLNKRSMLFFDEVLPSFGVDFKSNNGFLPFELNGELKACDISLDGTQSSQYITGLLMALPLVQGTSRINVENLISKPYIEMTLKTLQKFGVLIESKNLKEFIIPGNQKYLETDYYVEGDWSAASYWLVAAALGGAIKVQGVSMSSLQADKKLLSALLAANCVVNFELDGIVVDGSKRKAFSFDATDCPDLFPSLVTLAAFTEGTTTIQGANRLQNKESDRAKVLIKEFAKLGVQIVKVDDTLVIDGKNEVNGGVINSHHDHRIAMCFGIAGLFSEAPITIKNAEAVHKSYPDFWQDVARLSVLE
ncbi:MAG: 3-phosphoshikimate 1-carboxyvinyltransferase [Bacteroidota bacterium]